MNSEKYFRNVFNSYWLGILIRQTQVQLTVQLQKKFETCYASIKIRFKSSISISKTKKKIRRIIFKTDE